MSDGLNQAFKDDPVDFLRAHPLRMAVFEAFEGDHPDLRFKSGLEDFDLKRNPDEVQLIPAALRRHPSFAAGARWRNNPIRAFWLAWHPDEVRSLRLGDAARYFFTSKMNGCRLQISGPAHAPIVHHIAGNLGLAWRDAQSDAISARYGEPSRRFSLADYGEDATVNCVGVERDGRWRFYAQWLDADRPLEEIAWRD